MQEFDGAWHGEICPGTKQSPARFCDIPVIAGRQDSCVSEITAERKATGDADSSGTGRRHGAGKLAENKGATLFVKNRLNYTLTESAKVRKGLAMGIDTPTGDTRKLEELDRLIEGRWTLINRLFEDVEELVEERDRLAGRNSSLLDWLFGRRQQAPAPVGRTTVRRPEVRRPPSLKSADLRRRVDGIRAIS